jgi:UDP-N-acetylglucosamine transferase subunit ALG13
MIFVTVGTHEQQFNRLIEEVDRLKGEGIIDDEVIMQTGYSTYEPKYCEYKKLLAYNKMQKYIEQARIVITHGGPASFIAPLQIGKIPIVVPRQKQYDEHVNDHQLEFCRSVAQRMGNIIVVEEIGKLRENIVNYDFVVNSMPSDIGHNNAVFNEKMEKIVEEFFGA